MTLSLHLGSYFLGLLHHWWPFPGYLDIVSFTWLGAGNFCISLGLSSRFDKRGLLSSCGVRASHCSDFSYSGIQWCNLETWIFVSVSASKEAKTETILLLLFSHVSDENSEAQRGEVNLPNVKQLGSSRVRIQTQAVWLFTWCMIMFFFLTKLGK